MTKQVKLTAVGLGPGDPELVTLKGWRAIQAARIVFVPAGGRKGEPGIALRIARPWLTPQQEVIELSLPMVRNSAELGAAWQTAAIQIAAALPPDEPAEAVYLLLGDPLLYGTFAYIRQELAARRPDIAVEIIPGVTSFATAAAHAHMTLAAGAERVAILPADTADLRRLLADFDTVILMKAGPVLPQVLATLAELNLLETTLYAEYVGLEEERLLLGPALLANFGPGQQGPYLSLLIVKRGNALCP